MASRYIITIFSFLLSCTINAKTNQSKRFKAQDTIVTKLLEQNKSFAKLKQFDKSIAKARELANYGRQKKDTIIWLEGIYRLAFYNNKANQPYKALGYYTEGITLAQSNKALEYVGKLSINSTLLLNKIGDYNEAQKVAINGIETISHTNDAKLLYKLYNGLANAANNNFEFDIATEAYTNALKYAENDKIINVKNNLAINYRDEGNFLKATLIYENLLNEAPDSIAPKELARIESNYGFVLFKLERTKEAYFFLNKAYKKRKQLNDYSGLYASNIHLARFLKETNPQKAAIYANDALQIATNKTKSPASQIEAVALLLGLNSATQEQTNRYLTLNDSITKARERVRNEYTAVKFSTKEKEVQVSQLQEKAAFTALEIAEKEKQESYYFATIGIVTIGLVSFFFYVEQRKKIITQNHKIETLNAQENERNRISGNMHDSVASSVREAMLYLDHYSNSYPEAGLTIVADKMEIAYEKLREVSQENQHLNFNKISFPLQLQDLLEEKETLYNIAIDALGVGEINWPSISATIKTELFRNIQELLLNCSKHSQASTIIIAFKVSEEKVITSIEDNGVGCDLATLKENVGIADMRRRIALLDGALTINSSTGAGFSIILGIPLNKKG